jgi:hypothetical protein
VGGAAATDKFYLGRPLPKQTDPKIDERATLIIKDVKPADFKGNLELRLDNGQVEVYAAETPGKDKPIDVTKVTIAPAKAAGKGYKLYVEGAKESAAARATGVVLGVKGVAGELDHVRITVCHTEVVSNRKPADLKLVDSVPEKPVRKTKSAYIVAPIIVGRDYPVELRPYIEIAKPSAWNWTTPSATITLTDAAKEVVGLKATGLSAKLDDVDLEVLLTTDIGKLKKKHLLTSVHVEIDPITSGDIIKNTDPINLIKNPSGCVILSGADASDAKAVPRYEITKIQPNLAWKDDDDRIAWWIWGGEAKGANKYDGKAKFMNTEAAKRGTKVQVVGGTLGDILIQPYSGGYGYGMIRAHVIPVRKVKYRINRIFTKAQAAIAAAPARPAVPEQAALPAFPGSGAIPKRPAVPHLAAVPARPAITGVAARAAHAPAKGHDEAAKHIQIVNIFLRQMGFEMIPDDSAEMASPVRAAQAAIAEVAAQPEVKAAPPTPAVGAVPARPAVPARAAVPRLPAIPEVKASAANNKVGVAALDAKVVQVTRVSPGHFDVEVNDDTLTYNSNPGQIPAIRINARNEVISFAYIESDPTLGTAGKTLATALLCPANHAPKDRTRQPEAWTAATFTLEDHSAPSSSLIPKTGIPPDTPADKVKMNVLQPDVSWQAASPATRDVDLLWGIIVPTRNIETATWLSAGATPDRVRFMYGYTLSHEMGHVLGLGHRGDTTRAVPDGLNIPPEKNVMKPSVKPGVAENFDIIQTKAVRFSEIVNRTP